MKMIAYESPKTETSYIFQSEGVLCSSLVNQHDGFEDGGSITFPGVMDDDGMNC